MIITIRPIRPICFMRSHRKSAPQSGGNLYVILFKNSTAALGVIEPLRKRLVRFLVSFKLIYRHNPLVHPSKRIFKGSGGGELNNFNFDLGLVKVSRKTLLPLERGMKGDLVVKGTKTYQV